MGFLIDTDIWVAVERGSLAVADIHSVTGAESVFLSPVNVAELQMGIELVEDEATRRKALPRHTSQSVPHRPCNANLSWSPSTKDILRTFLI